MHVWKIEGKIEENEETRCLNDKKAYEDQFTTFCQFSLEFSIYSLSLSHSWSFLGAHKIWRKKAKERRKVQGDNEINNYNSIYL